MTLSNAPVTPAGIPAAEIEVDAALVRDLLAGQHPDLAGLDVRHVATGWDNTTFRLGDDLAVRLPRMTVAATLLGNEQRWLPRLAPRLPIPVPSPVRLGEPGDGFPWPWSVVPWTHGRIAAEEPPHPAEAGRFGRFLAALHQPVPDGFPRNDWRGVPLTGLAEGIERKLRQLSISECALGVPVAAVWDRWRRALAAPVDVADTCVHGDLHPKNLVVDDGRLAAVLDWGDMTAGDPAIDLGAAWMLFPTESHGEVWRAYGSVSADTLARAAGWAVFFGTNLLEVGLAGDQVFAAVGRCTLGRVCGG